MEPLRVWVGYDPREDGAYRVCEASIRKHASQPVDVVPLKLGDLESAGLYTRQTAVRDGGQLWDVISGAPMSTEFSLSRFLVPYLAGYRGWAVFVDCDFVFRRDIAELFQWAREEYAVMVVKHCHVPAEAIKMDGRQQTAYWRKNHSSLMLLNCSHWATKQLTPDRVNTWTGRALHGFAWLQDGMIGDLPGEWNYLILKNPAAVHFTEGVPDMPGYEDIPFADEYRAYRQGLTAL